MVPEFEAHRLIAISLGKIANLRIQRRGPTLHKNLLVASVLHRARSVVVVDDHLMVTECAEEDNNDNRLMNIEPSTNERCTLSRPAEVSLSAVPDGDVSDFAMAETQTDVIPPAMIGQVASRSPAELTETNPNKLLPSRCLKRRQAVTEDDDALVSAAKRLRTDAALMSTTWRRVPDYDSETEDYSDCEDHDGPPESVMDIESISSLVSAFSAGFKGLFDTGSFHAGADTANGGPDSRKVTLRRGVSLPDLCGKQATDVVSRPPFEIPAAVLALTA